MFHAPQTRRLMGDCLLQRLFQDDMPVGLREELSIGKLAILSKFPP